MISSFLINRTINIKRINPGKISRFGDLLFDGLNFIVKFLWTKRTFALAEIKKITAYSSVDWGLENEFSNVDVEFADGSKLLFDGFNEEHRKVIDVVLITLGANKIDWTSPLPVLTDKLVKGLVYQKNCH